MIDKQTFQLLASEKISDDPILKIEQVMYAVLAQVKDVEGTVCVLKIWRTGSAGKYAIKKMSEVQTKNQSFTTFGSSVLCRYSPATGEFLSDHLTLITPCPQQPYHPKIWVLNAEATTIVAEKTVDLYLRNSES